MKTYVKASDTHFKENYDCHLADTCSWHISLHALNEQIYSESGQELALFLQNLSQIPSQVGYHLFVTYLHDLNPINLVNISNSFQVIWRQQGNLFSC